MSEQIEYVFVWHALSDACPICRTLNGHEFHDQNLYQNVLWHPIYGNVWNLDADRTGAHPNCRCQLEVRVHIDMNKSRAYTDFIDVLDLLSG